MEAISGNDKFITNVKRTRDGIWHTLGQWQIEWQGNRRIISRYKAEQDKDVIVEATSSISPDLSNDENSVKLDGIPLAENI
jgi:hypothetical protein